MYVDPIENSKRGLNLLDYRIYFAKESREFLGGAFSG